MTDSTRAKALIYKLQEFGNFDEFIDSHESDGLNAEAVEVIEEFIKSLLTEREGWVLVPIKSIQPFATVLKDKLKNNPWPDGDQVWATMEVWADELIRLAAAPKQEEGG